MIQQGPRQECMWRQSYALFIYVALNFYSASIILHNINNNISYKVIPLCRSKYLICNSSGSNYINSMLNKFNELFIWKVGSFLYKSYIDTMHIEKNEHNTFSSCSDRFHLLVLASMYRPNYWYCTGTA